MGPHMMRRSQSPTRQFAYFGLVSSVLTIFFGVPASAATAYPVESGMVMPSTGTVTQDFLGSYSQETWFSSYYDQYNNLQQRTVAEHSGVDISNTTIDCTPPGKSTPASGQPVYPAAPGVVIWAGFDPTTKGKAQSFGWSVVVRNGYNIGGNGHYSYTLYGHMGTVGYKAASSPAHGSASCLNVSVGQTVEPAGSPNPTILGYQGSSGLNSPATHVHFTVFEGTQDYTSALNNPYVPNAYPASPDRYVCLGLTAGDRSLASSVAAGENQCGATLVNGIDVGNGSPVLGVAVNPTTNTIYAADFAACSVAVIDGITYTITNQIPLGCSSNTGGGDGIAVDQVTNTVYVTSCGNSAPALTAIDGATGTIVSHLVLQP